MHGVKRVAQSQDAIAAKKQRERQKLADYLALSDDVLARKKAKEYSPEAFELTTRLLQVNPEFYTAWNYRRNILTHGIFPTSSPDEIDALLDSDLGMTTQALKEHPKVYWLWNHRAWCLQQGSEAWRGRSWKREMGMVEKMLDVDARNFHAWNYRREVLKHLPTHTPAAELAYTTRKIAASFSNFSAWHQRSKVYTVLWSATPAAEETARQEDLELVRNAMYTDPGDQSAWVYHRWLVGPAPSRALLEGEIQAIGELLEEEPGSKWCMESLVHYKSLLLKQHATQDDERESLKEECARLLEELKGVDSFRKARYEELAAAIRSE
ncbi:hypothetical protein HWV62_36635 [Athelia sp. TMB]|nr:hypothetical protein HWV62_36635 [Athelia sp. TMB]